MLDKCKTDYIFKIFKMSVAFVICKDQEDNIYSSQADEEEKRRAKFRKM